MSTRTEVDESLHHLVRELLDANGRLTDTITHFRGLVLNDAPYSATVVLDANGMWTKTFTAPFAGVAIANLSAGTVTVSNTAQTDRAPTSGNGVMVIGSGLAKTKTMAGDQLSIYGPAGAQVDVTVYNKPPVPAFGAVSAAGGPVSTTSAITTAPATTASAAVVAANPNRKGLLIQNDGTSAALVAYGATASTTAYTVSIGAGQYWEMPTPIYLGALSVITASGTATLRVTELS